MIFARKKSPDFNWMTLRLNGVEVQGKKHNAKATRTIAKVFRYGSNKAVARTVGTSNVDDTVIELDWMGALLLFGSLGLTESNFQTINLAGKTFEMVEDVRDPETNLVKSAGGLTNAFKDCEIIGLEWSWEAGTETPSAVMITVSILDLLVGLGDKGGAGMSLGGA